MPPGKYYLFVHDRVDGPYSVPEIHGKYGAIAPETLVCLGSDYAMGNQQRWRRADETEGLAACIKKDISERLPLYGKKTGRRRLEILATDDDANIRALLWSMLADAGHNVDFARDGEEVFKRMVSKRYDLLILDVNMPAMNGYKVSELIHERLPNPPKVVIFTGRAIEQEKAQFMCSGADAILNKGTGNEKLLETIEALFEKEGRAPAASVPAASPQPPPPPVRAASAAEAVAPPAPPPAAGAVEKVGFYDAAAGDPLPSPAPPAASPGEMDGVKEELKTMKSAFLRLELSFVQMGAALERGNGRSREADTPSALTEGAFRSELSSLRRTMLLLFTALAVLFIAIELTLEVL